MRDQFVVVVSGVVGIEVTPQDDVKAVYMEAMAALDAKGC